MHKILVIEDEHNILESLLETLELEGFEAYGVDNGADGIEQAHRLQPDLIICDVLMPKPDGYEVLQAIKGHPRTASIPFMLLSAQASQNFINRGLALGANYYMTKPFSTVNLIDRIQSFLNS